MQDAILSTDPKAVEKIQARIASLGKLQKNMVAINKAFKAGTLEELGWSSDGIAKMEKLMDKAYSWEKQPFPGWKLANNNANINRLKKRLGGLS